MIGNYTICLLDQSLSPQGHKRLYSGVSGVLSTVASSALKAGPVIDWALNEHMPWERTGAERLEGRRRAAARRWGPGQQCACVCVHGHRAGV